MFPSIQYRMNDTPFIDQQGMIIVCTENRIYTARIAIIHNEGTIIDNTVLITNYNANITAGNLHKEEELAFISTCTDVQALVEAKARLQQVDSAITLAQSRIDNAERTIVSARVAIVRANNTIVDARAIVAHHRDLLAAYINGVNKLATVRKNKTNTAKLQLGLI